MNDMPEPLPIRCKQCDHPQEAGRFVPECPECGHDQFIIEQRPGDTPRCDFCSSMVVKHAYPARDFSLAMPPSTGWGSMGWWAACPACHRMIERGDRVGLSMRSAHRQARKLGGVSVKALYPQIRRLHDTFWANRQGPPLEQVEAK